MTRLENYTVRLAIHGFASTTHHAVFVTASSEARAKAQAKAKLRRRARFADAVVVQSVTKI